jgi:tRNA threonylcarbamoyladenosine biosynthesis protein TsaE
VTSPTYTLVHEYPTPEGPLIHIDAYRLPDPAALAGLGLDDYLERSRLVVVEWGAPLLKLYPDALLLEFGLQAEGDEGARRTARWLKGGA